MHYRVRDLIGQQFGYLTVVEYAGSGRFRQALWRCICSCGQEKILDGGGLRRGTTKSCGCLGNGRKLSKGIAARNNVILNYKQQALKRGYSWNLTDGEAIDLMSQDCFYCGAKPSNVHSGKTYNGDYIYSGIDRVDNLRGYELDNCVACCKDCNRSKNSVTVQIARKMVEFERLRRRKS